MTDSLQEIYKSTKSWPFQEAARILKKLNNKTPEKGYDLFETGYGPSGLPHIGTFGEVVRTCYVKKAFELMAPEIPTKLICISDDIDGLRKVPSNLPNQELIQANLGKPLTSVPDPFETHDSFGDHMNHRLKSFLDSFGFEYEFISATKKYKGGEFDETMLKVLQNYEKIMDVMLPNLGLERQKTYSPFMPIDKESGIVIDKGVIGIDKEKGTIKYKDQNGQEKEVPVTGGNCKLQWKIDFGARWFTLGVDYEVYGKDHAPNEHIYRKICAILGGIPPVNFTYEMFLSEDGAKISKSAGNGISVEDWLKYAPSESMALYMYQKPKTAKRLYFDVIPKAMDEYLSFLNSFESQEPKKQIENPAFHVHFGDVPKSNFSGITYSLLLNLASACNPENDNILWGFIEKYESGLNKENSPLLAKMVSRAINYYNDFIRANKKFRDPNENEKNALIKLQEVLNSLDENLDGKEIQNEIFAIGREFGYEENMRDWFCALYQILMGQETGPRVGSFIALYGTKNFANMIQEQIS
jgi:lysyl-tRNA synthetase class 1